MKNSHGQEVDQLVVQQRKKTRVGESCRCIESSTTCPSYLLRSTNATHRCPAQYGRVSHGVLKNLQNNADEDEEGHGYGHRIKSVLRDKLHLPVRPREC